MDTMIWWFLCIIFSVWSGSVWAASPVISAGADKTFALPQHDYTLFGTATDADDDPLSVTWSLLSGPTGSMFSAPGSLATTLSVTQTGTYTVRLTVFDGTTTVTDDAVITVNSAASQTAFYVDPTFTGGSNDGSATNPWTTASVASGDAVWTALNSALASNDVIVYFSARIVGSDTAEQLTVGMNLWRTDTSTHRLTLDGMSKYNTNDSSGSWVNYTGNNRFKFAIASDTLSIGVQSTNNTFPMHRTTIRGFDISGCSGRMLIAGSYVYVEYVYVHDVDCIGATVQQMPSVTPYPECVEEFGNLTDITYRSMLVERTIGEAFYIGGNYIRTEDGGCPSWGNSHTDILLENNTVVDAGANGGQGDGIDLKAGLQRVTIRGNTITGGTGGSDSMTTLGIFAPTKAYWVIEQNTFTNPVNSNMVFGGPLDQVIVRNNVLDGFSYVGIYLAGHVTVPDLLNFRIVNNTLYSGAASGGGLGLGGADNITVRNNLIFGICSSCTIFSHYTLGDVTSDYNVIDSDGDIQGGWPGPETNTVTLSSDSGVVVDAGAGNFALVGTSPARDIGVALTDFANDRIQTTRPQGSAWDVGAYEFITDVPRPTRLRLTVIP